MGIVRKRCTVCRNCQKSALFVGIVCKSALFVGTVRKKCSVCGNFQKKVHCLWELSEKSAVFVGIVRKSALFAAVVRKRCTVCRNCHKKVGFCGDCHKKVHHLHIFSENSCKMFRYCKTITVS